MKIFRNNAIYIQRKDLLLLGTLDLPVPASIFTQIFRNDKDINQDNKDEFIKFTEEEDIDYLTRIDWIADYNEIERLDKKEIKEIIDSIIARRNLIGEVYATMTEKEKRKNFHMVTECELLNYQIRSIREAYLIKEGKLPIELSDDIEELKTERPKGIQRILRKKKNNNC